MESELSLVNSELTKFALENFQVQIRERRPKKRTPFCVSFVYILLG